MIKLIKRIIKMLIEAEYLKREEPWKKKEFHQQ